MSISELFSPNDYQIYADGFTSSAVTTMGSTGEAMIPNVTLQASYVNTINANYSFSGNVVPTVGGNISLQASHLLFNNTSGTFSYTIDGNVDGGDQLAVRFLTTLLSATNNPVLLQFGTWNTTNHITLWYTSANGHLWLAVRSSTNTILINSVDLGDWSPVVGLQYEIEFNLDLVNGATRLFIDGVQLGSTITATGFRNSTTPYRIGGSGVWTIQFSKLLIFNAVQHTSNYTPVLALTTLSENPIGLNCLSSLVTSNLLIRDTTSSTNTITGALIVNGGVGVSGDMNIQGYITVHDTQDSSSTSVGSIICDGGVGIVKSISVGGYTRTNSLICSGTAALQSTVNLSGTAAITTISSTVDTTSLTTGCLNVKGGVAITKNLYVGSSFNLTGAMTCANTVNASNVIKTNPWTVISGVIVSGAAVGTVTVQCCLIDTYTVLFKAVNFTNNTGTTGTAIIAPASIPVEFRPLRAQFRDTLLIANNVYVQGNVQILTTGAIQWNYGFTGAQVNGWPDMFVMYSIN